MNGPCRRAGPAARRHSAPSRNDIPVRGDLPRAPVSGRVHSTATATISAEAHRVAVTPASWNSGPDSSVPAQRPTAFAA